MALSMLIMVFCTYVYFVSSAIAHVVMRKEVDSNIGELSTKVSDLEARYIEMQHTVSTDIAAKKGFVIADSKIFIDTKSDTLVLSRN
jgi:hypothetical protein